MQAKTGGTLAIGTVVVAITYATSAFRTESPPATTPPVGQVSQIQPLTSAAGNDQSNSQSVTVFYGTDRALAQASENWKQIELCLAAVAAALGFAAFAVWLAHHGHKRFAIALGACAGAAVVGLIISVPPWLARRGITEAYDSGLRYGTERGELATGYCEVSIPNSHREGEVESPSILRLELTAQADRHVMLQRIVPQDQQIFYDAVRQRVKQSPQRDLFVFVHGFNVTFEAAARRTAQIAHDLHYTGAPIFFSWPSQGKAWRYTVDETNVTWAVPDLKRFLTNLATHSDAQAINLIAHSMGNRALTQAIHELGYECQQDKRLFQQVVLAAPDIDADVFRQQIAPSLARFSSRVTLYASANDEALAASKLVHGANRAGESASLPLTVQGIDTIDVAMAELGPLGHSYYGSCPKILQDLGAIICEAKPASLRPWLAQVNNQGSLYWRLSDSPATAAASAEKPQLTR